jgi:hypothetical protein
LRDTLQDLAEFTRELNKGASPSESILGIGGDPAIDEEILEEELAAYDDGALVPLDTRAPAPVPPSAAAPAPRPLSVPATRARPLKV